MFAKGEARYMAKDYAGMLSYYTQALKQADECPCSDKAYTHFKVGASYYFLQQRPASLEHFYDALALAEQCNDTLYTKALRIIGSLHFELGKMDSARHYLNKTEQILLKTDKWSELSALYAIMGEVYEENDDYYFGRAEFYALKTGAPAVIGFAYIKQGANALEANDCEEAIRYLKLGLENYEQAKYTDGQLYAHRELAKAYAKCGSTTDIYTIFQKHDGLISTIFQEEAAGQTAHYRTLYETEKKERENIELLKNRRQLVAIFIITLLVLVLIFITIYSRYRLKKQKELAGHLAEQQQMRFAAVIEAEEKERQRIATDLHDGLGQMMSAARINLNSLENDIDFKDQTQRENFYKTIALIDESCKEVRTVSHSMMPNTLLKSGLVEAVQKLLNQVRSTAFEVSFYTERVNTSLTTNTEIILYRVIQECVNNVIKHAQATKLDIMLIRDEDGISVTIEDNGKGFDTAITKSNEGLGLKNIQTRIGYLNGMVEWSSAIGKGTAVVVNIPS